MATIVGYGSVTFHFGDNLFLMYGIVTQVGAADTSVIYCKLPLRLDGKKYRINRITHWQDSGAAKTLRIQLMSEDLSNFHVFDETSCASGTITAVPIYTEQSIEGGNVIRSSAGVLGAGKSHSVDILLEVI